MLFSILDVSLCPIPVTFFSLVHFQEKQSLCKGKTKNFFWSGFMVSFPMSPLFLRFFFFCFFPLFLLPRFPLPHLTHHSGAPYCCSTPFFFPLFNYSCPLSFFFWQTSDICQYFSVLRVHSKILPAQHSLIVVHSWDKILICVSVFTSTLFDLSIFFRFFCPPHFDGLETQVEYGWFPCLPRRRWLLNFFCISLLRCWCNPCLVIEPGRALSTSKKIV